MLCDFLLNKTTLLTISICNLLEIWFMYDCTSICTFITSIEYNIYMKNITDENS